MKADAVVVTFAVTAIEPLAGCGSLRAMANVRVNIDERFEFTLCGVQVRRLPNGQLLVQAPQFRDPKSGRPLPCIVAAPELTDAIGAEVIAAMEESTVR
jgi:hypothetical protein